MKAISIRQPWASLIASGQKTIEVRTWEPRNPDGSAYRGPLLICASRAKSWPAEFLPRGVALCIVDLVDTRPLVPADAHAARCAFQPGAKALVLANVRPIKPFPVSGRLGVFEVDVPKVPRQVCGCGEPLSVCDRHTPYRYL